MAFSFRVIAKEIKNKIREIPKAKWFFTPSDEDAFLGANMLLFIRAIIDICGSSFYVGHGLIGISA